MPRHTRRALLASIAGALPLAGCTTGPASDPTTDGPGGTSPTANGSPSSASPTGPPGTPEPVAPDHDAVVWAVDVGGSLKSQPTVSDGTVHVAVGGPQLSTPTPGGDRPAGPVGTLALDDGSTRSWTSLPAPPTGSPAALGDATYVTVGGSNGYTGVDQRLVKVVDGEVRWQSSGVDYFLSLLATGDGRAYLGTSDDALSTSGQSLFAVDTSDGETRWRTTSGDAFEGALVDGGLLVDLAGQAAVHYDAADGNERWRIEGAPEFDGEGGASVVDGAVLVTVQEPSGEALAAVDLETGTERWSFDAAGEPPFVTAGATVADGLAVGVEYDGTVFGLDPADGTPAWEYAAGEEPTEPVAVDGTVYVGGGGAVHAVAPVDGTARWSVGLGGDVRRVRATPDVVVATRTTDAVAEFVALDPADGTVRWRFEAVDEYPLPVVSGRWTLLASERGLLRAFRA